MFPNLLTTNNIRQQNIDKGSDSSAQSCKCNSIGYKGDTMNSESSIRFPADFSYITAEEELTIQGGTEIEAIDSIVSNITKSIDTKRDIINEASKSNRLFFTNFLHNFDNSKVKNVLNIHLSSINKIRPILL